MIYYRSARPVSPIEPAAICDAARTASEGRTWLSCERISFFAAEGDCHLVGGSKPNFNPHESDVAAASRESLPDGTARDMLDLLCRLSSEFAVDWELSHDFEPSLGSIRAGRCDEAALSQIEALGSLKDILGELGLE
ncbi:MAG TPA: hypothetical protein VGN12_07745 [Pirellulales bacterium]|jgi:hypothetical protein